MCVPGCLETVAARLGRRRLLAGAALAAGAAAMPAPARPAAAEPRRFSRVVDLTHTLGPDFPTFEGGPQLTLEPVARYDRDGYTMNRWYVLEHVGTHLDAPMHFSPPGVAAADEVPIESLVAPIAVVDIAARAEDDPDAQVTPDDIAGWEAAHGPIPDGACVAMHSGWERRLPGDGFRNADADGVLRFPGFHPETAQMLLVQRSVVGMAVDTLSLDPGRSTDFAVHYAWLPTGRWGLEAVANLATLPPAGATLVVGGPKIEGASGGPTRVLALV